MPDPVSFAVVVATSGRHAGAARAARSVLLSSDAFELCLVDQSDRELPPDLQDLARDDRVRVVKAPPHGLAAARNRGVALTSAPLIAFTDDDCLVEPGWLEGLAAAFEADPRVGLVFGAVHAAPYDRTSGFIPAYRIDRQRVLHGIASQSSVGGIGACMAVRRSTLDTIGGFDEQLGAGTPLCAAEDSDLIVRTLLAGGAVCETPDAAVVHAGFRSWREGREVVRGYMLGLGAAHAKMLRLAGATSIRPLFRLAWRWLSAGPVIDLNHRPSRLMRLRAFLAGAWSGWRIPLDETGRFVSVPERAFGLTIRDDAPRRHSPIRNT